VVLDGKETSGGPDEGSLELYSLEGKGIIILIVTKKEGKNLKTPNGALQRQEWGKVPSREVGYRKSAGYLVQVEAQGTFTYGKR